MKAVIYEKYGPPEVLRLVEIEKPTPKDDEVLVRVRATTVTIGDVRMRSFIVPREQWLFARLYLGVRKPKRKILGMELAGDIEAVGKNVTRFMVGDPIFASTMEVGFGGYAEYKCFPEDKLLAVKPANLSYEEAAAAVGAGMSAVRCLKRGNIRPGHKVLIYGASGAVGTNAVQLVKHHYGADVTGVCSARNLELVKSLGADRVIDYMREDFSESGETYDVVLDAVAKFPPSRAKRALKPGGTYLNVHKDTHADSSGGTMLDELLFLKGLLEVGAVKPVIERYYPLERIVEAHCYVETGRKRGNVAVRVSANGAVIHLPVPVSDSRSVMSVE